MKTEVMGPDSYLVEVLHYLNPHLIWVEVVDSKKEDFVFEQVGLYGILPFETTIAADGDRLKTQRCRDWVQAASLLMKKSFSDAKEIWFSPTHIDRRYAVKLTLPSHFVYSTTRIFVKIIYLINSCYCFNIFDEQAFFSIECCTWKPHTGKCSVRHPPIR